ncbi:MULTISPECIES: O-antigen ligase family protein [unclassified Flavobacterium]|uniref:O-antigen ligase family protein n=1 Tax=unclassified Flavobacterium TaxID=196869 RepID=UPI000EAD9EDC|nr:MULTISPECIES: O-antigen ligase family protein [unclassified Flavobacterium]RKS01919.1 O-antigen ligase-like membrane protein [Flavobacterium sp. 102]
MKDKNYILLVVAHALLGLLIYSFPAFSKIYAILIFFVGLYFIIKNRNVNNEVLFVSAYIVGSEVFLRMTGGNILYEFSKYSIMIFMLLGMYYSGFSKNAIPFWIYLVLLFPGVIVATETLNLKSDLRNSLSFNISGPACLGIAAIYTYNRKIKFSQLNNILLSMGLPIIATTVYLIFYTPELKTILVSTGSNLETSGGFGPNQVATVLGLGMFVFFSRLVLESKSKLIFVVNLIVLFNISYRGLVTFSRGGMITGLFMILILIFFLYVNTRSEGRYRLNMFLLFFVLGFAFTWIYTSNQTGGLIDKRYANQDATGRVKESQFTGREEIWNNEIDSFKDNPVFGIGVGKGLEVREQETGGLIVASHNELTRTIAEHGTLGIIALMIVFTTPMFLYLDNKQNIYIFCFLVFWILTINHAAMRIAAPAFVYSFSLLKVYMDE